MLKQVLENLNWSAKEAAIYLALLEHGSLIISDISKYSKINRVTVYDTIDNLIDRGAINKTIKNGHKFYSANPPELLYKLEQAKIEDFHKHLEDFKKLSSTKKTHIVKYFEGIQNMQLIYSDIFKNKQITKCFISPEQGLYQGIDFMEKFIEKRVQANQIVHAIIPDTPLASKLKAEAHAKKRFVKVVPDKKFNFNISFYCTNSKLYIVDFEKNLTGILIDSQKTAKSMEAIFDMCWDMLD
jgi:sugar-specific transcriptional regulator TrmB